MQNAVISVPEDNDYGSIMVRIVKFSLHNLQSNQIQMYYEDVFLPVLAK